VTTKQVIRTKINHSCLHQCLVSVCVIFVLGGQLTTWRKLYWPTCWRHDHLIYRE